MSKKHSKNETEILTYSIPLLTPFNKEILNTLFVAKRAGNFYLRKLFTKEVMNEVKDQFLSKSVLPAYKILEPNIKNKDFYLPNRINRGILEITGRILHQQGDRESLFLALRECEKDPEKWDFDLLKEKKHLYEKSQYIENLAEQTLNFIKKTGKFPENYFAMTKVPQLKRGMISYAPDDGQAIKIQEKEKILFLEMKVTKTTFPKTQKDWKWISFSIPSFFTIQGKEFQSPDLRCSLIHGKLVPILDMKVKVDKKEKKETGNFMTVDWGIRKLVTICVFNKEGEQISPPFFLKWSSLQKKLLRIRKQIDNLKSFRDKLSKRRGEVRWKKMDG